jgi:NitT/TauT family transport system substrate-binding protein
MLSEFCGKCVRQAAAFAAALALLTMTMASAAQAETIKAGVMKYGTVNWLLDVIKQHKLDEREGFNLQIVTLASPQASQVTMLSGDVDTIVTDWFWVLQQRAQGTKLVFIPYSAALGSLIVPAGSPIKSVQDLKGKRIGVAGSPIDKSWLLLRAYAKKHGAGDVAETATPTYAAPPLINELLISGQVDAVLNYWNLAAKLEAGEYRRVIDVAGLMKEFDIPAPLPLVGFVMQEKYADGNKARTHAFVNAMQNAQRILLTSDAEWDRIRPLMQVNSNAEFNVMRDRYREGLLHTWGDRDRKAAAKLFDLMAETGGQAVTGKDVKFDSNIFWSGLVF